VKLKYNINVIKDRQAHNLKVVGSNPTPANNYINKINDLDAPSKTSVFGFFLRVKPDNDHRVANVSRFIFIYLVININKKLILIPLI